jgi:hypothetical protein
MSLFKFLYKERKMLEFNRRTPTFLQPLLESYFATCSPSKGKRMPVLYVKQGISRTQLLLLLNYQTGGYRMLVLRVLLWDEVEDVDDSCDYFFDQFQKTEEVYNDIERSGEREMNKRMWGKWQMCDLEGGIEVVQLGPIFRNNNNIIWRFSIDNNLFPAFSFRKYDHSSYIYRKQPLSIGEGRGAVCSFSVSSRRFSVIQTIEIFLSFNSIV